MPAKLGNKLQKSSTEKFVTSDEKVKDKAELLSRKRRALPVEFQVSTYRLGDQRFPSVAALTNGGFVVTWNGEGTTDVDGVYAQRYDANGMTQGAEFRVNTYTTNGQGDTSVAALIDGGFVVTWNGEGATDNDGYGIHGQRYDASGVTQGAEFQVNTFTTNQQWNPSVAALTGGGFVVAWQSNGQDGSGWGIYGQRYDASGVIQGAEFQVNTYMTSQQEYPSVAALTGGGFVVTWGSYQGGNFDIYGQRYDAVGVKQGFDFKINTFTGVTQRYPSVAGLSDGGFVVAWKNRNQDGSGDDGVYGQRFDASGVAQGIEFRINTHTTGDQSMPAVTGLPSGGFVVVWHSGTGQDGDGYGVYGQRYDAEGVALKSEFQINTYTTNNQQSPSIASLSSSSIGEYVVVWESYEQDVYFMGIYGQIFADLPILLNNQLILNEGETVTLTSSMLSAQNAGADDSHIIFLPSNIQQGQFELGNPPILNTSFSQQNITDSQVRFVHDGGEFAPSYDVVVSNGKFWTTPEAAVITFTNVNDAPILNATESPVLTTIAEETLAPDGDTVSSIIVDGSIMDNDGTVVEAIAIINADGSNGVWQYSLDDGVTWNGVAPISDANSLLLDSNHKIRFIPNDDFFGQATFSFRAWDKSTDVASTRVNTSINGGLTAFSTDTNTATITISPINDAPVLAAAGLPSLTVIVEDSLNPDGDTINDIIIDGSISDVDGIPIKAIAVTGIDNANGIWQYSIDNGINWNVVFPVSNVGALLLDSMHKLRFVPNADFNGESTFTFQAWDKSAGLAGSRVDVSINGYTSAFSTASETASITILPVNDSPVVTGSIPDLEAEINVPFSFNLGDPIIDVDGDTLTTEVKKAPGEPLPSGISFDAASHMLYGVETSPSINRLSFFASDLSATASLDFQLSITDPNAAAGMAGSNTNNTTILETTMRSSAGAIAGAACLAGLRFFYAKAKKEGKTRENHPFADFLRQELRLGDVSNFQSIAGNDYLRIVGELEQELIKQNIRVKQMTLFEQKMIVKDVAEAIRRHTTREIGFFGYGSAKIRLIDIQRVTGKIAEETQRIIDNKSQQAVIIDEESGTEMNSVVTQTQRLRKSLQRPLPPLPDMVPDTGEHRRIEGSSVVTKTQRFSQSLQKPLPLLPDMVPDTGEHRRIGSNTRI